MGHMLGLFQECVFRCRPWSRWEWVNSVRSWQSELRADAGGPGTRRGRAWGLLTASLAERRPRGQRCVHLYITFSLKRLFERPPLSLIVNN